MRTIINIAGFLIIVLGSASLSFLAGRVGRVLTEENVPEPLPTIAEIQERIGCVKIDGKLSPDWRNSETQTKWDKAICDQYAKQYFEACPPRQKNGGQASVWREEQE